MNKQPFMLSVCLLAICLTVHAVGSEPFTTESIPFDKDLYAEYLGSAVENVPDLISAFASRQLSILPIVMPDPNFIHLQDGGLLPYNPDAFPSRFVKRLIPVRLNGITVYPVTIMEVPDSGERQILNVAGDVITEIRAPKDYDPLWYVRLRFPDLDTLDPKAAAWQTALYDPSRIMVRFQLITEDELIRKVMAESLAAQSLTMTPMALSYPATGLAFDSMSVQTNGTVDVSMSWPSGELATDGLDIFSCTDLMNQQWSILLTTNVNNAAGSFAFTAPAAGTGGKRFLDAWTHVDSDSDTLFDGREIRLYGTDRYDADTDADGMPDGWEQTNSLDPLDDTDADGDADSDGLSNLAEYQAGSDPQESDSDGDGLNDADEFNVYGTDPANADSDGDSLSDRGEVYYGKVSQWGINDHGEAAVPAGLTDVTGVAAGGTYCLALRTNGTITGWGLDTFGQISGAAGISNAVQIAAGYSHSVALLSDGSVIAWGSGGMGQTNVPPDVTNAVSIAAGKWHTQALLSDGSMAAWGWGVDGLISDASTVSNAVAIAAGDMHAMALLADGTVHAWGNNAYGQVTTASTISNAVAIAAGSYHSLALLNDGAVVAWGNDDEGQCSGASNIAGAVALDAGLDHSVALRADGSVAAWGGNTEGETDVPVGLANVRAVAASGNQTLALSGPLDPLDYDSDGDGLLDYEDITVDGNDLRYTLFAADGIAYTDNTEEPIWQRTFKGESAAGTDPFNWQSSGCGIPDGWAVKHGYDPLDPSIKTQDSDSDGVTNYFEMIYGTDPQSTDSDGDSVSDYTEIMAGSDPTDPASTNYPYGAAFIQMTLDYAETSATSGGNGQGILHIGPLAIPFSWDHPQQHLGLYLAKGVQHAFWLEGATDWLGGSVQVSIDTNNAPMVIHDQAGLLGTAHSPSYPSSFVAFPVLSLDVGAGCVQWPNSLAVQGGIVPTMLAGQYSYTINDFSVTPPTSTNGTADVTADFPVWDSGWSSELWLTFTPQPQADLTLYGTITTNATLHQCMPDEEDFDDLLFVKLHIDSLNARGYDEPTRTPTEYAARTNSPGKALFLNELDTDKDGIPDFCDGYDITIHGSLQEDSDASADFVPLQVQVATNGILAATGATLTFSSGNPGTFSDPNYIVVTGDGTVSNKYAYSTDGGNIRLWTRNGSASRNKTSLYESGSGIWVEPDKAIPLEMFDCSEDGLITLYIEAVSGSIALGDIDIHATLDPDGPATNAPAYASLTDHVVATVFHIDNVRPIAEDFVAGHEGQIMISTKHCTTNTPDRYYTTNLTSWPLTGTPDGGPAQHSDTGVDITAYILPVITTTTPPSSYPEITAYFEVIDPDDRSPYDGKLHPTNTTNRLPNDNRDPAKRMWWDAAGDPAGYTAYQQDCLTARSNVADYAVINGQDRYAAQTRLQHTHRYAGDNYQIRATLRKPDYTNDDGRYDTHTGMNTNNAPYTFHASTIQETIPLVSWKRVYIEQDHMYTLGATIVSNAPSGTQDIWVDSHDDFSVGNSVTLFWKAGGTMFEDAGTVVDRPPGRIRLQLPITNSIPAYAGIKPQGHTATYELTRDLMPQAYGSDPQGTDGGAFIEFRDAPTGNDTNGVPKYRVLPEWLAGTVHRDYVNMWFDNKEYARENLGNVLYLQSGNYAGALDGFGGLINGWNLWPSGASIVFCKDGNASEVLKNKTVVHEIGHRFGLRQAVGDAYSYIDADPSQSKRAHDNSTYCIMDYKSIESAYLGETPEFSIEGLLNGSAATSDDSLRSAFDR